MVTSMSQQRDDFSIRLGLQAKSCSHESTNVHTTMNEQAHVYVGGLYIYLYTRIYTYIHTYIHICTGERRADLHIAGAVDGICEVPRPVQ